MKKSILFSSIATTCCLLIQTSASAEWASFSGSVTHDYFVHAEWNTWSMQAGIQSHVSGYEGHDIYDSTNNWGGGHQSMSQQFRIGSQSSPHSGQVVYEHATGSNALKGTLFFSVTETSELSIMSKEMWRLMGVTSSSWSLSKYIAGTWSEIASLQNSVSDTRLITLQSQTDYQITINLSGSADAPYFDYNSVFNMSLTPVPSPAASALLALAGLVSRRRHS